MNDGFATNYFSIMVYNFLFFALLTMFRGGSGVVGEFDVNIRAICILLCPIFLELSALVTGLIR